jgi:hypothetical protein
MMVSRKVAYGPELLAVLNEGIGKLNGSRRRPTSPSWHAGRNLLPTQIRRKPR